VRRRRRQHPHALRPLPPAAVRALGARNAARDRLRGEDHRRGAARRVRPAPARRLRRTLATRRCPQAIAVTSAAPTRRTVHTKENPMAIEKFDAVDLIRTKRDRGILSTEQIDWLVEAYTRGYVGDE